MYLVWGNIKLIEHIKLYSKFSYDFLNKFLDLNYYNPAATSSTGHIQSCNAVLHPLVQSDSQVFEQI